LAKRISLAVFSGAGKAFVADAGTAATPILAEITSGSGTLDDVADLA